MSGKYVNCIDMPKVVDLPYVVTPDTGEVTITVGNKYVNAVQLTNADNAVVSIRYLPGAPHLELNEKGDWVDLYTYEDFSLGPDEFYLVNLGVAMKLPDGFEAHVAPRSSTFKRWGILQANSVGIIDNSYCGDTDIWMMPIYTTRAISVPKGTRLCQFRLVRKQPNIVFHEVDTLNSKSRGGFGSTGV